LTSPQIVMAWIVHINQSTLQGIPTYPWSNILNQTRPKSINEEHRVVCCPSGHIKKTFDSVNQPRDRNQTLCRVDFLLDALRTLITRRRLDRIKGIIEEESGLIHGDNPSKVGHLLFHQSCQREKNFEYDTLSLLWWIDMLCGTQRRWNCSN
jgi:hypothetical protein